MGTLALLLFSDFGLALDHSLFDSGHVSLLSFYILFYCFPFKSCFTTFILHLVLLHLVLLHLVLVARDSHPFFY